MELPRNFNLRNNQECDPEENENAHSYTTSEYCYGIESRLFLLLLR